MDGRRLPSSMKSSWAMGGAAIALIGACGGPTAPRAADAGGDASTRDARGDACAPPGPGVGLEAIHLIGRFDTRDPAGPRFAWPGSQIIASFTGAGVSVRLDDSVGSNTFVYSVDGAQTRLFPTARGASDYPLATNLGGGTHTLSLVKRTESVDGVVQLLALTPQGGALVPTLPPTNRKLEFIGDSITSGFGILGGACTDPFTVDEDWTQTAGARAAAALDAAPTSISYSGIGVYRGVNGGTTNQMPDRWLLSIAEDPTSLWPFTAPPPAAVVVDLGTNDFADGDPGPVFETTYTAFLRTIRSKYAEAWLLVAVPPMTSGTGRAELVAYLTAMVAELHAGGDARVAMFDYGEETSEGCLGHPSVAYNSVMESIVTPIVLRDAGFCP